MGQELSADLLLVLNTVLGLCRMHLLSVERDDVVGEAFIIEGGLVVQH